MACRYQADSGNSTRASGPLPRSPECWPVQLGENALNLHGRGTHRRDLSTPPQSLPLLRTAVEMTTAMDARSILMPIAVFDREWMSRSREMRAPNSSAVSCGLDAVEFGVLAVPGHELLVRAEFHQAGAIEHDDEIGHAHGGEAV